MAELERIIMDAAPGPWHPAAIEAFESAMRQGWADPRARHREGRSAADVLNTARERVAAAFSCRADEVSFDAGGAAASRRAVTGLFHGRQRVSGRIITSAVEHSSILQAVQACAFHGSGPAVEHVRIGVDSGGALDSVSLAESAAGGAALASIQAANSETGVQQATASIAEVLSRADIPWHVDASAVAAYGDIPAGWSVLTADATSWAGPTGVGVLAVTGGARWRNPDFPSDSYEHGRVPGLPAIPSIAAAAAALEALRSARHERSHRLAALSTRIREAALAQIPHTQVHSPDAGSPHITSMSFLYVSGEALATELDARGYAVGSGSACANELHTPSHVLAAMGRLTEGNLRLTLPWDCTEEHVSAFIADLPGAVRTIRERFGAAHL